MDDFFALFLKKFDGPSFSESVSEDVMRKYSGLMPECILSYWRDYGWASFGSGRIWMTNPDLYNEKISDWVRNIPELCDENYFVFARSAFGNLYAVRQGSGSVIRILPVLGFVLAKKDFKVPEKVKGRGVQSFFATAYPKDFDFVGEDKHPLFDSALAKLGELNSTEMYGFEPILAAGGSARLANLKKIRMDVHLDITRQFAQPTLRLM